MKFDDALNSCESLLREKQFDQIARLLESVFERISTTDEAKKLLDMLERIPTEKRIILSSVREIYAKTLVLNAHHNVLNDFISQVIERCGVSNAHLIQIQYAISLQQQGFYAQAKKILEITILHLTDHNSLGLAWGRLGWSLFELGEPWIQAFKIAKKFLKGIQLGLVLINEGHCFSYSDQNAQARVVWLEALPIFRSRPSTLALIRYNLGISTLRDLEPEAEHHFLEGVRLTKNPKAASMQAAILNGLGASRRVLGEWHRAEFSYRQALQIASDLSDREESHLGLARTLRLSGRPTEALETLELALHIYDTETPIVNVARSMAFLALNDTKHAKIALERVGTLVSVSDQWLYRVASAELARREGRLTDAVDLLEGMPVQTLHMREEVRMFPKLFELLSLAEKPVPVPLEYIPKTIVRVLAQGVLRVFINDRKLELAPTGRPAELLVFLLEQGGMASLERIMDAFFPDATSSADQNRARKAIWKFSDQLRHALGWQNAVQALRGAYMLDQDAIWQYDITEARAAGVFQGEFFKGVYSSWAIETAQSLEGLSGHYDSKRTLN